MRRIFIILFALSVLSLKGREPEFNFSYESSPVVTISPVSTNPGSLYSAHEELLSKILTNNSLVSHFSQVQQEIYRKERFFIKSKFSGRINPLLKATNIKLSYRYVVLPVYLNRSASGKYSFIMNSSPFVSVLLNRKSIYSEMYAFHGTPPSHQPQSLHDLGVSIGAGVRVPISSRFQLDVGVRDELGLLNLDGLILKNNSFSQNNSLGVILGLKYKI